MLRTTLLSTTILLTLTGCARVSESRANPFNWFSDNFENFEPAPIVLSPLVPENSTNTLADTRPLVQSITSLTIDPATSGAIVRATGVAATQGSFNAELVDVGISDGVLLLEFRAQAPSESDTNGTDRSRQITSGYVIDASTLAGIRSVRVQAETNARTASR